jgi:thymidylate synthase
LATREVLGVQFEIIDFGYNVILCPQRNLNYKFMVAEWLWIHEGHNDVQSIGTFNKKYFDLSDDGKTMNGAYGPHWVSQRQYVVNALKRDPWTRQAVITFWNRNPAPSKDIPCTISMQFLHRDGALHMVVNMRSSDIWLGIPYDAFTFAQMGNWVASELGYKRGDMILQLGSSHMYETDYEKASEITAMGIDVLGSPLIGEDSHYEGSILKGEYPDKVVGLQEPWRSYAEILGRPRSEAQGYLWQLANLPDRR